MAKKPSAFDTMNDATMALGPLSGLAREDFAGAVGLLLRQTMENPDKNFKAMSSFSEDVVQIMTGSSDLAPDRKDKRFMDPAWQFNPFFKAGAQYYLAIQKGVKGWIEDLEMDALERDRANFISQMVIDALAPTNSLIGNPTAQKRLVDSGGLSLIKGLRNAYDDMVNNKMMVSQVNKKPFKLGENIATAKGNVVYRDDIMELVQYAPTTDKVYAVPQLTIPPQINKMYINDLSPEKSVVKWQTDHGIQPFVISWKNPTEEQGVWNMTDYVNATIKALDVIQEITGSKTVNVSGACSGGQTMSVMLSKLAAMGDKRIGCVTMMVCVLEPKKGDTEASSLISDHGVELARQRAAKKGIVSGDSMARGFAWLRPNDLIWNYVINNYLLGDDPPAFDILFWNADATNLSGSLLSDFLDLFVANAYAEPATFEIADHVLDLTKVDCDMFILGGSTDHITPWQACYRSTQLFGGKNIEFVLSQAGHMQAILNPPGNPKAKYFKHSKNQTPANVEAWMKGTEEVAGSWWPYWMEWLTARAGKQIAAPKICGSKQYPAMESAPGLYVHG
ncbi:class II poly(R)-hydroxyalkanoic acid synthase [Sphingorhabdus lutea]|uniref:Class II poly(R)-hydroxyalkanoic acid synthase n=1 Tax=Sphingorhabdus lutea TaxID=1913578 RepID=A0A1L3JBB5_9SPHN|nr:alpha/beta fold hydrolase [Sphingorhabdus lutea]APG62420.1 class II poly(R)-hydroxyalkanoic acid synthase [Sphingorhabdus lutea]